MQLINTATLSDNQIQQIDVLWNQEYPKNLMNRFSILLGDATNYQHFILENEAQEVLGWAVLFVKEKETRFFQEALVEFYQPKTLFVFLTPTVAKHSNWAELQTCLSGKVDLKPIENIPESNSPDDGWIIFDKMTGCLNEGDRVIFDLTHSFRCIPVVALLAISYLRTVKQVNIEGLLGVRTHGFNDQRADRDVRHEATIHDINVDPISTGSIYGPNFFTQAAEIGG